MIVDQSTEHTWQVKEHLLFSGCQISVVKSVMNEKVANLQYGIRRN